MSTLTLAGIAKVYEFTENVATKGANTPANTPMAGNLLNLPMVAISSLCFFLFGLFFFVGILRACIYFPKFVIYSSCSSFLLLSVLAIFTANTVFIVIMGAISLIFFLLFIFAIYRNINYTAKMLSATCFIINEYLSSLLMFVTTNMLYSCSLVILAWAFNTLGDKKPDWIKYTGNTLSVLLIFWTAYATMYALQVFVSSLIFNHIGTPEDDKSVVNRSMYTVKKCLGSIFLGSLLVALVVLARMAIENKQRELTRSRSNDGRGVDAMQCLVLCFAWIAVILLETFLHFTNALVFSYIALYDMSYREAAVGSFNEISHFRIKRMSSMHGADIVAFMISFTYTILSVLVGALILYATGTAQGLLDAAKGADATQFIMPVFLFILILLIFGSLISTISSGVLALLFARVKFGRDALNFNPSAADELDRKMEELQDKHEDVQEVAS